MVRPRFEQHLLTKLNSRQPQAEFAELRYRSMSMGLGQILGDNYRKVGAASARAIYTCSAAEQIAQIARFLAGNADVAKIVRRTAPEDKEFRTIAGYYNGPKYEAHHYHESLSSWFTEFRQLAA